MRTTLTLDEDVATRLRELSRLTQRSFKETVNDVLRAGLNTPAQTGERPFTVIPHETGIKPGVDPRRLNQLIDELEAQNAAAETSHEYGSRAGKSQ
ncbi:MAG: antitoxin [Spirochaetia bacterium]